jgi:hypothetical protein
VSERGYDVSGNATCVTTLRYSARPYIIVRPGARIYPAETEIWRVAAPKHTRNTVTTPAEERATMRRRGRENAARQSALLLADFTAPRPSLSANLSRVLVTSLMTTSTVIACDPQTAVIECPEENPGGTGSTGVGGGGTTLSAEMTSNYCYGLDPSLDPSTDRDNDRIRDDCEADSLRD